MAHLLSTLLFLNKYAVYIQEMKSVRLRHFCEICRKQCKDENGFHCHLNSAFHQKRLRQLATNPQQHIEKYSKDLEIKFLQMLKIKYPGQTKNIQDLFEEYKTDNQYIKFNMTEWRNLEEFVEHLRKTGRNLKIEGKLPHCTITYLVNKSSDFIIKKREQQLFQKRQKQKQIAENRLKEKMEKSKQIEQEMFKIMRSKLLAEQDKHEQIKGDRLQLKLDIDEATFKRDKAFDEQEIQKQFEEDLNYAPKKVKNVEKLFKDLEEKQTKKSNMIEGQKKQEAIDEQDEQWITQGIIVKILPHQIPQAFHNKKSTIIGISEPFVAKVKVGNATLEIDQSYLETVIPKLGHQVRILKGKDKGKNGELVKVDIENGSATISIKQNQLQIPFNSISKVG